MNGRHVFLILSMILITSAACGQITVVSSVPANGAVGVSLASTVSFTFSEALDTSRHLGNDGLCVIFLAHDPPDSMQAGTVDISPDLRTLSVDLVHTANTDFVWLLSGAFAQNGDTLSMPFPLCYTTAASHGDFSVSGVVSVEGGGSPLAAVIGLMNVSPFGDHGSLLGGTVITNPNGSYSAQFVRPGVYFPITARDGNHDGNMDADVDLIGIYDPNHTGEPQSITVTDANVGNVDLVLRHLNQWTTARARMDTAIAIAATYGSDYHLVLILSTNDTIGLDGLSRSWYYGFYSAERNRGVGVDVENGSVMIDTTAEHNQYPPTIRNIPSDFLDSDSAMAIVESHGGAQIRAQHNVVSRELFGGNLQWFMPPDTAAIFWMADYSWQQGDSMWQHWQLFMDMRTGQILVPSKTDHPTAFPVAQSVELLPNYPNPFNPSTTVPFVLPRMTHVELKIYDVQGREAATLVNGNLPAGAHTVRFEARHLANGIYFCQLKAGETVLTRKMLLIK